jgi:hypothetical protein
MADKKDNVCTSTPFDLYFRAEGDVIIIMDYKNNHHDDYKYNDIIGYHITQAVEKFLKGYIIKNGKETTKTHDIKYLFNQAININNKFKDIEDNCVNVNKFTQKERYEGYTLISFSIT